MPARHANLRKVAFALATAAVLFSGIEGVLRLGGWYADAGQDSPFDFEQLGTLEARPVAGGVILPGARSQVVASPKRATRVYVIGGSAAQGSGYTPFTAMPGWAERILRRAPGMGPIEVFNGGVGGLASTQLVDVVRSALTLGELDLLVVYAGNNEMLDALEVVQMPDGRRHTERISRALWGLHGFRMLSALVPASDNPPPPPPPSQADGELPHHQPVQIQESSRREAHARYRDRIDAILDLAEHHGVPVVLTTVATNQRDHLDPQGSPRERELYEQGQQHLAAGRIDEAREAFAAAEENAARPSRADRTIRATIRALAERPGATLCDLEAELSSHAEHGIPGRDLFFDSCHFNAHGHQLAGTFLAGCIAEALGEDPGALTGLDPNPAGGWDPQRLDHHRGFWEAQPPTPGDDPAKHMKWGHLHVAHSRMDQAATAYQRALELGAPPAAMAVNLGLVAQHRGQLDDARRWLDQATAALPDDPDLAAQRAVLGP